MRFSAAGALPATAAALVSDAPAGQFSEELGNVLHVGTEDVLRKLVQERKLSRRKLNDQFLRAAIVLFASLLDEKLAPAVRRP